jgi:hypothetical protein
VSRSPRSVFLLASAGTLVLTGCAGQDPGADGEAAASPSATSSAPPTTETTETTEPTGTTPTQPDGQRIEVYYGARGEITGDTGRVSVRLGETVVLVVDSVAPDEVHVHGYDLASPVSPFSPAEFTFRATLPGVFEVELHDAGAVLLTLQVQ